MVQNFVRAVARGAGVGLFAATLSAQAVWADIVDPSSDCPDPDPIAGFTPAEPAVQPRMKYPRDALDAWSEGWVLLEYAITEKGEPRNMVVIDAVGPKDFVKVAFNGVSKWRYKPAMRNGTPVEQSLYQTSVLFLFNESGRGADHREFVAKYNRARTFIRENKPDEAIAILEEAFKRRLNLYEAAMGSFVLAVSYAHKSDWERALFHIEHATIEGEKYLEPEMRPHARALEVELFARTGNFHQAVCGFDKLKKNDPSMALPDSQLGKIIASITAAMKDPKPIGVDAYLAKHPLIDDAPAVWRHRLLRSKFWFTQMKGEVKSFRLACLGTSHEAAVDSETLWDVPKKAGTCILRVEGAPGATFKLVEEW